MFLNPTRVDAVIEDMQSHTLPGGYNLIVGTMHNGAQLQFATLLARKPSK
ncbi:MAG: hypothetical protein ACQEVQ_09430 [Pseudomonadota bacterium]